MNERGPDILRSRPTVGGPVVSRSKGLQGASRALHQALRLLGIRGLLERKVTRNFSKAAKKIFHVVVDRHISVCHVIFCNLEVINKMSYVCYTVSTDFTKHEV